MKWVVGFTVIVALTIIAVGVLREYSGDFLGTRPGNIFEGFARVISGKSPETDPAKLSWNESEALDKGCIATGKRRFYARCEDDEGRWSHGCFDPPRDALFKGKPLASAPLRSPNQDPAWIQIEIADEACILGWNVVGAHDRGCSGEIRTYHVRCERPDGQLATECPDMARGEFKGAPMLNEPNRLEDSAWSEVQIRCDSEAVQK